MGKLGKKKRREEGLDWVIRSKFEDDMANFMMEKKHHLKGLIEMLHQQQTSMHEQVSQILSTLKGEAPANKPTLSITTRSGVTTQDPPFPTTQSSYSTRKPSNNKEPGNEETPISLKEEVPKAMIHMPKGAKVLKDLLSHKEKLEKAASSVKLSEECSAIIQRSFPQKEGDPGSFTLPCLIGPLAVKNALSDLGASINL
ncbi:hypothetical protein Tco_0686785, partial [Tanacetum coccineum]